jgi:hypothetical protein
MTTIEKKHFHTFTAHDEKGAAYAIEWWRERLTTTLPATGQSAEEWGKQWFLTDAGASVVHTGSKKYRIVDSGAELMTDDELAP